MAMGIQQQQQQQQGEPPMFPGDFVEYGSQYESNERQAREAARNGRYRRPRSPSLDDDSRFTTGASELSSEAPMHDQRGVPANQMATRGQPRAAGPRSGPPSMANASQNRRSYPQPPPVQSQVPPYAGNPDADEWSPAARGPSGAATAAAAAAAASGAGGGYSRRRTERHARRQSSTSGGPAPGASDPQMSGGASPRTTGPLSGPEAQNSPRVPSQSHQQQQQQQQLPPDAQRLRPPSPPVGNLGGFGASGSEISRLQSPSISKSVLEPLQRKMLQYHNLMEEASGQMSQLDDEIRALQERRRLAEQRFVDAKNKHDEYERQHLDVEKALRGDYGPPQLQQLPQVSQQQHQMYTNSPPRTVPRPPSSIMSYDERPMSGRSSMGGKKGKFRISLFGR